MLRGLVEVRSKRSLQGEVLRPGWQQEGPASGELNIISQSYKGMLIDCYRVVFKIKCFLIPRLLV